MSESNAFPIQPETTEITTERKSGVYEKVTPHQESIEEITESSKTTVQDILAAVGNGYETSPTIEVTPSEAPLTTAQKILFDLKIFELKTEIIKIIDASFIQRAKEVAAHGDADTREKDIITIMEQLIQYIDQLKNETYQKYINSFIVDDMIDLIQSSFEQEKKMLWLSPEYFDDFKQKLKDMLF